MAVTYDAFLARFPEFKPGGSEAQQAATQVVIAQELTRASNHVNANVWGDQADDGIVYLAAHRIATRPGGSFSRLMSKDGSTMYGNEYDRMRDMLLVGDRVV